MDRLYKVEVGEEGNENLLVFDNITYSEMKQKEMDYIDELHFRVFYYSDITNKPTVYLTRAPRVFSYSGKPMPEKEPEITTESSVENFNKVFTHFVNESTKSEGLVTEEEFAKFIGKDEENKHSIRLVD